MRHKGIKITMLLGVLFLFGCSVKNKQNTPEAEVDKVENTSEAVSPFQLPTIPVTITSQEEHIRFLANHYWDLYDFTNTLFVAKPEVTEQALVDFLALLTEVEREDSANGLKKLVRSMGQDDIVYKWFKEKLEHYLYNPNSPMRQDELYIQVLEEELALARVEEIYLERSKYQLKMLKKNRVGMKAANFNFRLPSGKKNSLWNLKSKYTLLLLYNPECSNCQKAIEALGSSTVLAKVFEESAQFGNPLLTVLSVSVEGSEEEWEQHLSIMPWNWLNGYDEQEMIHTKELYDLRSVPSIYLLDENKKVLIKDANAPEVLEYLANLL